MILHVDTIILLDFEDTLLHRKLSLGNWKYRRCSSDLRRCPAVASLPKLYCAFRFSRVILLSLNTHVYSADADLFSVFSFVNSHSFNK